ncbi:MAG: hypothetical protein ACKO1J_01180 [Tagaea sp.]
MGSQPSLASKRRSLPFVLAFAVALFAALGAYSAATYDRRETRAHAVSDLADIARLQAEMTDGFLDRIDQSLRLISYARLREGRDFDLAALIAEGRLDGHDVLQFGFIDPNGLVTHSSLPLGSTPVSVADRPHFRAIAHGGQDLHIGVPVLGRVSNRWTVQVTRRANGPDGAFLGVAMASIDVEVFGRLLDPAEIRGAIALVGEDGVVRARGQGTQNDFAISTAGADTMTHLRAAPAGAWEERRAGDAVVTFWRKLDAYPLYVTLTVPAETLTAGAAARARFYWAAAALAALIALAAAFAVARRHRRAEAALEAAHAADAEKTRLLLSLGAELRHPVDMLRWSIDALSDSADEAARKRALADLRRIDGALGRAINDAAELARLMRESKELDLSVVDARLFARGAFEVARARAGGSGTVCDFALDLPDGLRILADEMRLRRVADTLLGAAFERAGRGGRVGFSVGARGLDQRNVEIAIAVTASGEDVSASGPENGVVAALAQAMGGKIERLSAPGGTLDVFKAGFARTA